MGVVTEGAALQELTGYTTWEELVRDQAPKLFRVAIRLTHNRNDAENVVQEAFLRIYTALDKFTPGNFNGWAYRIAYNASLDALRNQRTVATDPEVVLRQSDEKPSSGHSAELRAFQTGAIPTVAQLRRSGLFAAPLVDALETLPARRRDAILCRALLGMTVQETSAALGGVPAAMVRKQVCLGLNQLQKALEGVPSMRPLLTSWQRTHGAARNAAMAPGGQTGQRIRRSSLARAGTAARQRPPAPPATADIAERAGATMVRTCA